MPDTKTLVAATALAAAEGFAAGYAVGSGTRIGDEDRPPIIVKNGSIQFETSRGWADDGGAWKPDHNEGKPVREFVAAISNAIDSSGNPCPRLSGVQFIITYALSEASSTDFHVILAGREPKIPKGLLNHSGNSLTYGTAGAGRIGAIRALPTQATCTFASNNGEISIGFSYQ